jgi:hypothetical protein
MAVAANLAIIPQRPNLARFATIIWLLRKRYFENPTTIGSVTGYNYFFSLVRNKKCEHTLSPG